tara:strand:- start:9738 stop:10916 length:1179 start_codon:yes stop_codon:yes gene_type:complete
MSKANKNSLLLTLSLTVCVITPFSNDIFLPSLPHMAAVFKTGSISLVMTIFMLGLAISQLFYGPLSDRFGRKPVLMVGLVIYTLASLLIVYTTSFHMLLLARFLQAVGTCASIVSAMAIARDSYADDQLVKKMSMMMAMIGVCPLIAPLLGGYLQAHFGWQGSFVYLLALGVIYLFVIGFFFRETLQEKNHHALHLRHLLNNYMSLLKISAYRKYIMISACSYGILFAYGAAGALIMMDHYHLSSIQYGWVFFLNAIAILIMSIAAPRLVKAYGLIVLARFGVALLLFGSIAALLFNLIFTPTLYTLVIPMWIATLGVATIRPIASSGAMSVSPKKISGSAAAMFSFMSFVGGALSTWVVSLMHVTVVNMAIEVMVLAIIAAWVAYTRFKTV